MEDSEPDKKRPNLDTMARNSDLPTSNQTVDATVLQYQNQKLVQQLDIQKHELHDLDARIQELRDKQTAYDDTLIAVNQLWNQLSDDLILLGARAGGGQDCIKMLDREIFSRGSIPSCPSEDMFLCRLLEINSIKSIQNDGIVKYVKDALASRHSSIVASMKFLEETIDDQRTKIDMIAQALHGKPSAEDAILQLSKIDEMMGMEAKNMREVIDALQLKQKEYAHSIETFINNHSMDQSEIKRLAGELEETMTELEERRRKLINLTMQKDAASGVLIPISGSVNGKMSPEKPLDRSKGLRKLKDSIEETKILATDRLSELQEAQQENAALSKELEHLQDELKDDKHVHSSRLCTLVNDQLLHWNAELERYKAQTDSLQADRSFVLRREKEVNAKLESADAARSSTHNPISKIEELELRLQKCITERSDAQISMEEVIQGSGREDIKREFRVMALALSKEMNMMEAQLTRWKKTAQEAVFLRQEAHSIETLLGEKITEQQRMADRCDEQMKEIRSLKTIIEITQKEKLELQIILDMYGNEAHENRDMLEIKESERRAHSQTQVLRNALDEHSLELRVKAASETEAACQQRLCAAQTEITELRSKLDASERNVLELKEAIKAKDAEAEAYISEMETIGQAYEDMQTQHQNLLQQVTERDEYNIKLVSESVKTKQAQSSLYSEKQTLAKQLQQVNASVESFKVRIARSEEQMKACLNEAIKATEEDRNLSISIEAARWELMDAEKEMKWLKSSTASSEREYEQIKRNTDKFQTELDCEKNERNKLEEELAELNREIAELTSENSEAAVQKLQDDIKDCKRILKCGVCFDRPKEVVILKCFHLFCNQCIQRNLGIRHRKCPGCGTAFGQNDVRAVRI